MQQSLLHFFHCVGVAAKYWYLSEETEGLRLKRVGVQKLSGRNDASLKGFDEILNEFPLGYAPGTWDVAITAVFLASDAARCINGATVVSHYSGILQLLFQHSFKNYEWQITQTQALLDCFRRHKGAASEIQKIYSSLSRKQDRHYSHWCDAHGDADQLWRAYEHTIGLLSSCIDKAAMLEQTFHTSLGQARIWTWDFVLKVSPVVPGVWRNWDPNCAGCGWGQFAVETKKDWAEDYIWHGAHTCCKAQRWSKASVQAVKAYIWVL